MEHGSMYHNEIPAVLDACADAPQKTGAWRRIAAKKRCIDPLIIGTGRVSAYAKPFAAELGAFLSDPQTEWLAGE
ncbi:MAG: hypothetical protein Q4B07_01615 [Clostridia bacterium]|nr:hypothetical protein [Clostridia bacterium]